MRRKAILLLSLVSLIFIVSGCIDSTTVISINGDGSGEIMELIGMNKEMAKSMKAMMTFGQKEEGESAPEALFKREDFEKKLQDFGEGVILDSFETFEDENSEYAKVIYSFDDINKIKIKQGGDNLSSGTTAMDTEKEVQYITFNFTKDNNTSTLLINMPKTKEETHKRDDKIAEDMTGDERIQVPSSAELGMLKQMFKGLHFAAEIQVNGKITKTNAMHVAGNRVTLFDIDFNKFLDNDEILMKLQKFENPQEAQEVFKSIEGVKFEPSEQVSISFIPGAEAAVGITQEGDIDKSVKFRLSEGSQGSKILGIKAMPGIFALGIVSILIAVAAILIPAVIMVWLFCRIFRKAGYSSALGILMIFPFVNLIMLMILAFLDWPIYNKFASLGKEDSSPIDTTGEDQTLSEEPHIELDKPLPIKKSEEKASEEPGLPLPAEAETKEMIQKEDKDKADESSGEEKPKIMLSSGELGPKPEETKEEPTKEEPEKEQNQENQDKGKDSTTDV